jgi:hypothetical protein
VTAIVGRIIVALVTSAAVATATLDPCAMTCHPQAGAGAPATSSSAHCRAASTRVATIWESTAACHHNHDVASLDATPQARVECPGSIGVVALAQDLSLLTPAATLVRLDTGQIESCRASSETSAFAVPLRL